MGEDREYGLEDGRRDAEAGHLPACSLTAPQGEYETAYAEAYQRYRG